MTPLGLYLHVPFCARRCDYCDFYVVVGGEERFEPFVARMEAAILAEKGAGRAADTLYIGGGTPSILEAEQIGRLVAACRIAFALDPAAEITMEANPEGVTPERLDGWLEAGINRLSIGIQSIRDATLRSRGRLHTGRRGLESVGEARAAGFVNVAVDFIAGLPQGEPSAGGLAGEVAEGIRGAVGAGAAHVSLYMLETDKEAPLMEAARQGRVDLPSDDETAAAFVAARDLLTEAGYEHYEISSFCRPGRRSRHNLKYWTGEPFLGIGPSAHSSMEGRLTSRPRDLEAFLAGAGEVQDHTPSGDGAPDREALVMGLRLLDGVDLEAFDAARGTRFAEELPGRLADLEEAGVIRWTGKRLALTPEGVLMANELFSRVWEAPSGRS